MAEYHRLSDAWDEREWAELETNEIWIEAKNPSDSNNNKMKFIVIIALCCGFLFTLINGFIILYNENEKTFADSDVTDILNQLAQADDNGAKKGDIQLDYQNMASHHIFGHDNAPNPLFTSVNNNLISKSSYTTLLSLLNLYTTPDDSTPETLTQDKYQAINSFLSSISSTTVYNLASVWLAKNNLVLGSNFNDFLTKLWFTPFARTGSVAGSSGFKYTFSGETSGNQVIGFNNWYQFYSLEKSGSINYHGWFERQKDVQISLQFSWNDKQAMLRNFLVGTSPEFDLLAYTICGLAGSGSGTTKTCSFTLQGYPVTLTVETISVNSKVYISSANPTIGSGGSGPSNPTSSPTNKPSSADLQALIDEIWANDVDKAQPGDVQLNWGNKVSGTSDTSSSPLFTYVNETLFQRPVYAKLIDIYNQKLFHPSVCTKEDAMEGQRKQVLDEYLRLLANTTIFQTTYNYLVKHGYADPDFETFYQNKLFSYWYGTYSRCKGTLGSSGWEHVYSGEWKGEEVDGQHNWARFYLLEKAGDINYHGYYSHEGDLIGTFQYTWSSYLKKIGGFFITTSPSFDFSVFTTCVMTTSGSNCKFNVDGKRITVTAYHQSCNTGTCISTSYPSDE